MGFNLGFKGLNKHKHVIFHLLIPMASILKTLSPAHQKNAGFNTG